MRIIERVDVMQRAGLRWRRQSIRVGMVPTMGCLHAGHLSLVRRAREEVGARGMVVVSIYVNPTQFGPGEDFSRYPRQFARDRRLCREAGADVIFCPSDEEMYAGRAEGHYSTYVVEETLSRPMEGVSRPTHFRGVTTVVAKLFNIVQPEVAVVGAKDFQQAAIVQRMVADLNLPVRVLMAPTVREPDGLAMSSRNRYLNPDERVQARALWEAIRQGQAAVGGAAGPIPAGALKRRLVRAIERHADARVDYLEIFDSTTLAPVRQARPGAHLALAVYVGSTRLIDNAPL